jgi:uncharacterized protein (DUF362 family)
MTTRAKVALLGTKPGTVLQDYERLMELAGFRASLDRSAPTILKIDASRYFPFPAANTTPWQLEGAARTLQRAGHRDLVSVQHKTVITRAFKGQDLNGYGPIFQAYDIAVWHTFEPADMCWVDYQPKGKLLVLDRRYKGRIRVPGSFFGKNIVHLPTMKTDRFITTSGALRSALVGLFDIDQPVAWGRVHESLVDLLTIHKEIYAGRFAVMDGTTASDGPARPQIKNAIVASGDVVALDAVATRLMGGDPLRDVKYLRLAHERGLGVADPREIELVGDYDLAKENWQFNMGDPGHYRLLKPLQRRFRPTLGPPRLISELYRDFYRWPVKERSVFESWLYGTQWGRLFGRYQKQGYGRGAGGDLHSVRTSG